MRTSTRPNRPSRLVALALACAAAAAFWVPSFAAGRGWFPAPLDDVYIHFDFARSLASGHPFEWIPGQGYSSGETSPLYAVLLAIGWLVGFRGKLLGVWAALVAIASVASLLRSIRTLLPHTTSRPAWLGWILALVPLSIGVVDWALWSGMEVAAFVAALGHALVLLQRVRDDDTQQRARGFVPASREALQWRLGAWGAALVLLRPEAVVIAFAFAVIAARGAGRRSGFAVALRGAAPAALATLAVLGLNRLATGDARSAGAQLKLLSSNPYMSEVDRARVLVENLITFWLKVVRGELAVHPALLLVLPVLALVALARREHRAVAAACVLAALGWILLVSWNGNAPHHNFRYYVPGLVLLAIAASFGLSAIAQAFGRGALGRAVTAVGAVLVLANAASRMPGQVRHFRTASANIRDQHIEVGERIARLPEGERVRVLLGDAGAIPYVSRRTAIDALGLGGYQGVPFAHAAVHGEASTIELIERLAPSERPTHFALYPNWFSSLTSRFGVEIDRVTIQNNIICGSPTKGIYRADWSALADPRDAVSSERVVDALDVADVVDEEAHGYVAPLPHGGWTTLDVLEDPQTTKRRFDGGRTIPEGARESFVVAASSSEPVILRVRVNAEARRIVLRTSTREKELELEPVHAGWWRSATTSLDAITKGDVLTLEAPSGSGGYRDYHVWIERVRAPAAAAR